MKKIILAAAAVVALSGSAFAGSDNFNGVNPKTPASQSATVDNGSVDHLNTGSISGTGSVATSTDVDGYQNSYQLQPQFRH
jgi:hypothetical protein